MKKSRFAVTLPALIFVSLLLSGCSTVRSTRAWEKARQENSLQIPPDLDRPASHEALIIPPPVAP